MFSIVKRTNEFNPWIDFFDEVFKNPYSSAESGKRDFINNSRSLDIDVIEEETHYNVLANLPGIKKEDVKVSLDRNYLSIEASYHTDNISEKPNFNYRERFSGNYRRIIHLGEDANQESISAKMEDGVLTIQIAKTAPNPRKEIEIK